MNTKKKKYLSIFFDFSTTLLLTLFSQVMVNVQFPYVVYRKGAGLQIRTFALFKLFPVTFPATYSIVST